MKTFSAQPGPSALLEYCKIRPGFEASYTIKHQVCMHIFNAYGALLCALTERKTERELARARTSVVSSQQHDKQQQVREERTYMYLSCTCTSMGLCVVYMAMARGAYLFFGIFKVGIHVHFLKASADFQKTYGGHPGTKWRVVYMGNCTHFHPGTIWTELKVVPG